MAIAKLLNLEPATGALAMFGIVDTFLTGALGPTGAGWDWLEDSDGSVYSSSGTAVTNGGTGAGGLGNELAWVLIEHPSGEIFWTIQHNSAAGVHTSWRIETHSVRPTGGTITQVPTSADGKLLAGGGTSASPTFGDEVIGSADGNPYHIYAVAMTTAPYLMCVFGYDDDCNLSTGEVHTLLCVDGVQSWTLTPGDVFPYLLHAKAINGGNACHYSALSYPDAGGSGETSFRTWLAKGLGPAGFVFMPMCSLNSDNASVLVTPNNSVVNPVNSVWDLLPVVYNRRADAAIAPRGFKGWSTLFTWNPSAFATIKTGDKFTTTATGDVLVLGDLVLNLWENDTLADTGTSPTTRSGRIFTAPTPDSTAPVVSNISPAANTQLGSAAVQFDVTDNLDLLRRVFVWIDATGLPTTELAHNGTSFAKNYAAGSARTSIANGYHYSLVRVGGFPSFPTISVDASDTTGNEA